MPRKSTCAWSALDLARASPKRRREDARHLEGTLSQPLFLVVFIADIVNEQSPSDVPVVHLAVHPSAWASSPPSVATSVNPIPVAAGILPAVLPPAPTSPTAGSYFPAHPAHPQPAIQYAGPPLRPAQPSTGSPPPAALPAPTSIPGLAPISVGYINFVAFQHLRAAMVLRNSDANEYPPPTGLADSRNLAVQLMTIWGYAWPTVLDEEYPPPQDESAGIKYEPVTIK